MFVDAAKTEFALPPRESTMNPIAAFLLVIAVIELMVVIAAVVRLRLTGML
jgi:hypothetical protein